MRCDGSACKELVRGFWGGGGIFHVGGGPQRTSNPRRNRSPRGAVVALAVALTAAGVPNASARAQSATRASPASVTQLAAIAGEEDARGLVGLTATTAALSDPDPRLRRAAVRALGRLQSVRHLDAIIAVLNDGNAGVRTEAATAIGQALQEFRGSRADNSTEISRATSALSSRALTDTGVRGATARTLGRIPYNDSLHARRGEGAIIGLLGRDIMAARVRAQSSAVLEGVLHGLYSLARARRSLGAPSAGAVAVMRSALSYRGSAGAPEPAARVRRLALLGLSAAGHVSPVDVRAALADRDEQVRRLVMTAQSALTDTALRVSLVRQGLRDRSPLVRHEAARAWRAFTAREGCSPLITAVTDPDPHVVLSAIDGLTSTCADAERALEVLLNLIDTHRSDSPTRARGRSGWHVHAHALVAVARTSPLRARSIVRRDADSGFWAVRVYATRAATILHDTLTLTERATDTNGNVREAALAGLAALAGHSADSLFIRALASPDYHVVREAAGALKGSPQRDAIVAPLFTALERITQERRETSRDPRMALLERIGEAGEARHADRLEQYRTDFDSSIAMRAATILSGWSGRSVQAEPRPLARTSEAIEPLLSGEWRARFTMAATSGGGSFEITLFPREALFTVARFVRLSRAGYYNGLTFHRVEPGFVIQGGSPAATEYVGDGPFMRDELAARSHTRGTLGISTRGRDTGDAQIFVNLMDNFRLDHDYTVFGEIVRGRDVAERVMEADVIEKVEIVSSR